MRTEKLNHPAEESKVAFRLFSSLVLWVLITFKHLKNRTFSLKGLKKTTIEARRQKPIYTGRWFIDKFQIHQLLFVIFKKMQFST